ncbi:hypothetical protein EHP00_55 [Ecytonucleospora hepatopenaei]|uniref:Uncharacterized protein n=1 Tax=Ecytonucleospora hepatopenaei TaxID=646526 RepID=A0A1W0E5T8_9MICR|nr:hypothetical protein EHP00_55 [Ecytonucleospora hepatopenaei]
MLPEDIFVNNFCKTRKSILRPKYKAIPISKACYYLRVVLLSFTILLGKKYDPPISFFIGNVFYALLLNALCYGQMMQGVFLRNSAFTFHGILLNIYMIYYFSEELIFISPAFEYTILSSFLLGVTVFDVCFSLFNFAYISNKLSYEITNATSNYNLKYAFLVRKALYTLPITNIVFSVYFFAFNASFGFSSYYLVIVGGIVLLLTLIGESLVFTKVKVKKDHIYCEHKGRRILCLFLMLIKVLLLTSTIIIVVQQTFVLKTKDLYVFKRISLNIKFVMVILSETVLSVFFLLEDYKSFGSGLFETQKITYFAKINNKVKKIKT